MTESPETYAFSNLTAAVKDQRSPLRLYLNQRFPNCKPVQAQYKQSAGPLLVDGGSANPGTLGAAYDFGVRLVLNPNFEPRVALLGYTRLPVPDDVMAELLDGIRQNPIRRGAPVTEAFSRTCWVLALCAEIYRTGQLMPGSPLIGLLHTAQMNAPALLDLAPADAVRQLDQLHRVSVDRLYSQFDQPARQIAIGPTFEGSILCPADADIIIDGVLLELKTHLGSASTRTRARSDTLPLIDLYQLVSYALFDRSNAFMISELAVYSARYGNFVRWSLQEVMNCLADEEVDIAHERRIVWGLLGGSERDR